MALNVSFTKKKHRFADAVFSLIAEWSVNILWS